MNTRPGSFLFIWTMPLLLGALTVFGLLAALLGNGTWHVLAWVSLAVPVMTVFYYGLGRRSQIRD
ncbi:hypothetical protein [Herbaspirillum chlorophenolicum]|uniref:hypothetical protein n=1 Tax=Herbaspirillum chlorophenolicum TaxID=211589 RepID=UPI0009E4C4E7|nr:hypothetical protein [Herbaspirillum chlorophenolicum]